ncbi:hypothetical protein RRG08_064799 [Elysia crispata]|uniref:Uncharacterized protein n=1 Tax=Elysia crispata TaxID=231223 RepID=A0AAE1ATV0_9GAST|nr:hypothetical protein RRG08_064799 [Elysia crispata]
MTPPWGSPRGRSLEEDFKRTAQFTQDETLAVLECRVRLSGYGMVLSMDKDEVLVPRQDVSLKTLLKVGVGEAWVSLQLVGHVETSEGACGGNLNGHVEKCEEACGRNVKRHVETCEEEACGEIACSWTIPVQHPWRPTPNSSSSSQPGSRPNPEEETVFLRYRRTRLVRWECWKYAFLPGQEGDRLSLNGRPSFTTTEAVPRTPGGHVRSAPRWTTLAVTRYKAALTNRIREVKASLATERQEMEGEEMDSDTRMGRWEKTSL